MTDSMVERVARAILRASCNDDAEFEEMWDDAEVVRHNRLIEARTAIAAMREPTEGMVEEGLTYADDSYSAKDSAKQCWQAMIDEALK